MWLNFSGGPVAKTLLPVKGAPVQGGPGLIPGQGARFHMPQPKTPNAKLKRSRDTAKTCCRGFPGGSVVKNLPANAGDTGSSPGPESACQSRTQVRYHMPRSN